MISASRRPSCSAKARSSSLKASGARGVVEVQHAEHAALVDERHAERRLDVEPLAHHVEGLLVGLAAQADRPAVGGGAARDPLAEGHADLRPELALDAHGDAHRERAPLGVEEHQRAAVGAGHADRDLEHAREELVGVDGEVHRLDDLVERLEQLGLAVGRGHAVAPEQARRQGRDDLERRAPRPPGSACRRARRRRRRSPRASPARAARRGRSVSRGSTRSRVAASRSSARARGGLEVRIVDRRHLEGRVVLEQGDEVEGLLRRPVDGHGAPHQSGPSASGGAERPG